MTYTHTPRLQQTLTTSSVHSLEQHPGCSKTSRYGYTDAPLTLCQSHKRAGMYTIRDGRVLVSTRDGKGETRLLFPPVLRSVSCFLTYTRRKLHRHLYPCTRHELLVLRRRPQALWYRQAEMRYTRAEVCACGLEPRIYKHVAERLCPSDPVAQRAQRKGGSSRGLKSAATVGYKGGRNLSLSNHAEKWMSTLRYTMMRFILQRPGQPWKLRHI